MKDYLRYGLKTGTLRWLCFCMVPMGLVVFATVSVAETTERSWIFWGCAAAAMWVLIVAIESLDHKRRHGDR